MGYSAELNILGRKINSREDWNPQKNGFELRVSGKEIPADLQGELNAFEVKCVKINPKGIEDKVTFA